MIEPQKYRAKDLSGNWVTGWYALLHIPNFNGEGHKVDGYELVPSLFNDEPGERGDGGYWRTIDPDTLEPISVQLKLF